jgi:hypothetical protein
VRSENPVSSASFSLFSLVTIAFVELTAYSPKGNSRFANSQSLTRGQLSESVGKKCQGRASPRPVVSRNATAAPPDLAEHPRSV